MKAKEEEKAEEDRQKLEEKRVREEKRIEREKVKKEKEERKRLKQLEKGNTRSAKSKMLVKRGSSEDKIMSGDQGVDLSEKLELLHVESEDDAICPKCGLSYLADVGNLWVECGSCGRWFDFKCTIIKSKRRIPDSYCCEDFK